jgi:hypothetical protein
MAGRLEMKCMAFSSNMAGHLQWFPAWELFLLPSAMCAHKAGIQAYHMGTDISVKTLMTFIINQVS